MIRCDEAMKKSKEKCYFMTATGKVKRWRCNSICYHCICGLKQDSQGIWSHVVKKGDNEQ